MNPGKKKGKEQNKISVTIIGEINNKLEVILFFGIPFLVNWYISTIKI